MSTFNISMFDSIKEALSKEQEKKASGLADLMVFKPGNTYTVRLLPVVKKPSDTFFHYYAHGWNSLATGQYVSAVSPTSFGDRDPIAEERYKVLRTGSEEEKEKIKVIRRTEHWLVNVFVVDDPTNPENNGQVKVLRYGKQLDKIIKDAISGDGKEEYGARIFDLGPNGVNFKIKVEKQSDYPWYASSRFTTAGTDLKLTEERQKEIYNGVKDLTAVFRIKSQDELKQMLDEHYYCKATNTEEESSLPEEHEAVMELSAKTAKVTTSATADQLTDDDIDNLLKDL